MIARRDSAMPGEKNMCKREDWLGSLEIVETHLLWQPLTGLSRLACAEIPRARGHSGQSDPASGSSSRQEQNWEETRKSRWVIRIYRLTTGQ